ncbi:uncharacterized protein PG986_004986 [Apiospora aurea]|uniref:Uncharacterized protein n=1 Tax=Apiospora aurea TaxID=335848 RepID=A0ABR1QG94_9PEZI
MGPCQSGSSSIKVPTTRRLVPADGDTPRAIQTTKTKVRPTLKPPEKVPLRTTERKEKPFWKKTNPVIEKARLLDQAQQQQLLLGDPKRKKTQRLRNTWTGIGAMTPGETACNQCGKANARHCTFKAYEKAVALQAKRSKALQKARANNVKGVLKHRQRVKERNEASGSGQGPA